MERVESRLATTHKVKFVSDANYVHFIERVQSRTRSSSARYTLVGGVTHKAGRYHHYIDA